MKTRFLVLLPLVLSGSLFAFQDADKPPAQGVPQEEQPVDNDKPSPGAAHAEYQAHVAQLPAQETLGTVDFPTSCAALQQAAINRGVALLHDFWYDKAEQQFKDVVAADPACAIAYWGEAMSLWHEIWDRPGAATLQRGLVLVQQGQKAGAKTQRERDYLNALAQFYQNSGKDSFEVRVAAYSQAMGKLLDTYPADHEAAAFYALSLLAAAPPRDTTFANQKRAMAVLNATWPLAPDNPGIAHYIIHACDNPQMAPQGLEAARKYGEIAPSAPHAAHMPSHIFARLGLWQEDIEANLASIAAAEASRSYGHELHAMDFLNYAYLQVGEDAKAWALVEKVNSMDVSMGHDMHDYLDMARAGFPATYDVEMRHWKAAAALQPAKGAQPQNAAITYWARAVGSGHLKDAKAAKQALAKYDEMVEAVKKSQDAYMAEFMDTDRDEIRAWVAFAEGNTDEAAKIMGAVADKQDAHGKGEVEIPAREMLADILLESGHAEQALAQYERSMTIDPNRFNGLYGAARSAELTKQTATADKYYAQLVKNCEGSGSKRPELVEAKAQLAGKTSVGGE
jgi:tetratricopeptide (TPR) repeat protein